MLSIYSNIFRSGIQGGQLSRLELFELIYSSWFANLVPWYFKSLETWTLEGYMF